MRQSDAEFATCPIPYPTKEWRAIGVRAVDGDTLVVRLDRGFWDVSTIEIRLRGIDAVELNDPRGLGAEARQFTAVRIAGAWLTVVTHMDPDKYGRLLADVRYPDASGQWRDLATELRAAGYEKPTQ